LKDGLSIEVRALGLQRNGRWLFQNVDLHVPAGSFVAVVGPSGAGKSSFLAALAGLLIPQSGEVRYCETGFSPSPGGLKSASRAKARVTDSANGRKPGEIQQQIGFVFQDAMLVRNASLLTNVLTGRLGRYPWWQTIAGFGRQDRAAAYSVLCGLGLGELAHRLARDVSGGEQQRTAVARALFQEPQIILADEPVSSLDNDLAIRVLDLLHEETRSRNRTVFCVLHDTVLVERFADLAIAFDGASPGNWRLR
jgi:phosphonate transport system ATP-binding protein